MIEIYRLTGWDNWNSLAFFCVKQLINIEYVDVKIVQKMLERAFEYFDVQSKGMVRTLTVGPCLPPNRPVHCFPLSIWLVDLLKTKTIWRSLSWRSQSLSTKFMFKSFLKFLSFFPACFLFKEDQYDGCSRCLFVLSWIICRCIKPH